MIFNPFWITLTKLLVMPGTSSTSPVSAPDHDHNDIIMHEILHTVGFCHEQNRPDRDEYIKIDMNNVRKGKILPWWDQSIHTQIQNTGKLCCFRYERVY